MPDTATEPARTMFRLASEVVAPTVAKESTPNPASRLSVVVAGTMPLMELLKVMLLPMDPVWMRLEELVNVTGREKKIWLLLV